MKSVFHYLDYRQYMKDWYDEAKAKNPAFSFRAWADKCGYKSKSFIPEVLSGKKRLSPKSVEQMGQALGLKNEHLRYFEVLTLFQNSRSESEKKLHLETLQKFKRLPAQTREVMYGYEILQKWHVPVIREIICSSPFDGDYTALGNLLEPPISKKDAREAVQLLINAKLVEKQGNGFKPTDKNLIIRPEVHSIAVREFQKKVLELGNDALIKYAKENRNIQTITLGTNPELRKELNRVINVFINEVVDLTNKYPGIDRVEHLNIELFPLTKLKLDNDEQN